MERERIIYILEYLSHYTDCNRAATLKQIKAYLENHTNLGKVSLPSIRRDIASLISAGNHIEIERGAHNIHYYRMQSSGFTFNEIRFFVDSVSFNQFLTADQKQRLFHKFEGICSQTEARKLIAHIKMSEVTPPSLDLLENLDIVYQILEAKRKINFAYGKYNEKRHFVYTKKKRDLTPCSVVYYGGRFYLKCINGTDGKIRTYRVDRMREITMEEPVEILPQLPKAQGAVVDIFEPEYYEVVKLRVNQHLLDDMLEKLGKYAYLRPDFTDDTYVIIHAKIGISYGFYRWLLKYGDTVEVLSPPKIRKEIAEIVQHMAKMYQNEISLKNSLKEKL